MGRPLVWLAVLMTVYVLLGTAYALRTPVWQNPDEPAHYNYVHQIAAGWGLPVLQSGDYDQADIERLVAARFRPGLSVEGLRYEGHQPPLYYLLGAVIDRVLAERIVADRVLALRLLGVVLGLGIVVAAYQCGRRLFPAVPALSLAVAALPALVPQHVAMTVAVNNDALGWLLSALVLWVTLIVVSNPAAIGRFWPALGFGLLLGAIPLTKTTAYASAVLPLVGVVSLRLQGATLDRRIVLGMSAAYGLAALVGGTWFARNLAVYGGLDILGLARHNEIAGGQPLALGWDPATLRGLATTLFQSAWAQLGWMTVPAQPWVYGLLAALSGLLAGGALLAVRSGQWRGVHGRAHLLLLSVAVGLAVVQVAYYNLQFLQPQGRYLFSALVPAAGLVSAGVPVLVSDRLTPWFIAAVAALLVWLNVYALTAMVPFLQP